MQKTPRLRTLAPRGRRRDSCPADITQLRPGISYLCEHRIANTFTNGGDHPRRGSINGRAPLARRRCFNWLVKNALSKNRKENIKHKKAGGQQEIGARGKKERANVEKEEAHCQRTKSFRRLRTSSNEIPSYCPLQEQKSDRKLVNALRTHDNLALRHA